MTRDELYMKKALELAEIAAEQGGAGAGSWPQSGPAAVRRHFFQW